MRTLRGARAALRLAAAHRPRASLAGPRIGRVSQCNEIADVGHQIGTIGDNSVVVRTY